MAVNKASKKILTNAFLVDAANDRILLGMKKRGFGVGKYNGFGGKVELGETILEGARREMLEEAGIEVPDLKKVGEIVYRYDGMEKELEVHVFRGSYWTSDPVESEEMKPQWFKIGEIPFDTMWGDDKYWFPYLLEGIERKSREDNHEATAPTTTVRKSESTSGEICDMNTVVGGSTSAEPTLDQSASPLFEGFFYFADDMKTLKEWNMKWCTK